MTTAMTTFSQTYYAQYGRECLASLVKHWPGKIVAYYEYEPPRDFADRVEYRDLMEQEDLAHFLKWTSMVPLLQGLLPNGNYHYKFNANKFARKVFAISDLAKDGEPFFFLGADTRALKDVPEEWLNGLIDGKQGCFLLRRHMDMHVESDFAGYDPRNKRMRKMLETYREMFINGSFLELDGWHDCVALDRLLDAYQLLPEINNLSDGVKGEGKLGYNVWPNTVLAEYFVHLKGKLKKGGIAA